MSEDVFKCGGDGCKGCAGCRSDGSESEDQPATRNWKWSRPYKNHSGHTQIRIDDEHGRCVVSGYCKSDDDAELIVKAVNRYISEQHKSPSVPSTAEGKLDLILYGNAFEIDGHPVAPGRVRIYSESAKPAEPLSDEQIKYRMPLGALHAFNDTFCNRDSELMATAEAAFYACTKALLSQLGMRSIACTQPFERIPQHAADPVYGPVPPVSNVVELHPQPCCGKPDECDADCYLKEK